MANNVCAKCGKDHRDRCLGHIANSRPPKPCTSHPVRYGTRCGKHGGFGRLGRKGYQAWIKKLDQEEKARKILDTYGEPVKDANPVEQLMELIAYSAGHVKWLRQKVQETAPDDLIWGTTEHVESTEDVKTKEVAAPSVWLKLYDQERDRLADMCDKAIRNGIEAKRVEIAQKFGEQLLRFAGAIFNQLLVALEQQGWVREELEEVWPDVTREVLPLALEASKETSNGKR